MEKYKQITLPSSSDGDHGDPQEECASPSSASPLDVYSDCGFTKLDVDGKGSPKTPDTASQKTSNIQVYIRARPFSEREEKSRPIVKIDEGTVSLLDHRNDYQVRSKFKYTHAFDSIDPASEQFAGQKAVYDRIGKQMLDNVFEGYNACLLAYGQTGSGKTHTMMGNLTANEAGVIPRLCAHLFARIEAMKALRPYSFKVEAMYCEIYNEKVRDLLCGKGKGANLKIRQSGKLGTVVEGLSGHCVNDMEGVVRLINRGNDRRSTASTDLNNQSSRSHAVFTLNFSQTKISAKDNEEVQTKEITSKIYLVDLAGSERIKLSGVRGAQLEEAKKINLSLTTLGRVIESLVEASGRKTVEAPYRESALTWMLRNSFGGNSKTIMIATISPSATSMDETMNTLRYASRTKKVVNKAVVNVKEEVKRMADLEFEIEDIQKQLEGVPSELLEKEAQIGSLTEQLRFHEHLIAELQNKTESVRKQWEISDQEKEQQLAQETLARERLQSQYEELYYKNVHQNEEVNRLEEELREKERALKTLILKEPASPDPKVIAELEEVLHLEQVKSAELAAQVEDLVESLQATTPKLIELTAALDTKERELAQVDSELQSRTEEKDQLQEELERTKAAEWNSDELRHHCQTLQGELHAKEAELVESQTQLMQAGLQSAHLKSSLEESTELAHTVANSKAVLEDEVCALKDKLAEMEVSLDLKEQELQTSRKKAQEQEDDLSKTKAVRYAAQVEKQMKELEVMQAKMAKQTDAHEAAQKEKDIALKALESKYQEQLSSVLSICKERDEAQEQCAALRQASAEKEEGSAKLLAALEKQAEDVKAMQKDHSRLVEAIQSKYETIWKERDEMSATMKQAYTEKEEELATSQALLAALQKQFDVDKKDLQARLVDMEEQCTQKDAHVNALTRQRMELSTNLTELELKLHQMELENSELMRERTKLVQQGEQEAVVQKQQAAQIQHLEAQVAELSQQSTALDSESSRLRRETCDVRRECQSLQAAAEKHQEAAKSLEAELQKVSADKRKVDEKLAENVTQVRHLQESVAKLKQDLAASRGASEEQQAAIKQLQQDLDSESQRLKAELDHRAQTQKQLQQVTEQLEKEQRGRAAEREDGVNANHKLSLEVAQFKQSVQQLQLQVEAKHAEINAKSEENLEQTLKIEQLNSDIAQLRKEVEFQKDETRQLYERKQRAVKRKEQLKERLNEEVRNNEELHEQVVSRLESQVESLELMNSEMSKEYNARLTKLITDSNEWKTMMESVAKQTEQPPKSTSFHQRTVIPQYSQEQPERPGITRALSSLFKSSRPTSIRSGNHTPTSSEVRARRTSVGAGASAARRVGSFRTTPTTSKDFSRCSFDSQCSSSFELERSESDVCMAGSMEELAMLRVQNKVLESNIENLQRTMRKLLGKESSEPEGVRFLLPGDE